MFSHSPYCLLHNEFLGLVPIHLDLTIAAMKLEGNEKLKKLADLVASFPAFTPLPKLNSDLEARKGWDGKSYTSFYKMAVIVFRETLDGDKRKCWYVTNICVAELTKQGFCTAAICTTYKNLHLLNNNLTI